MVQEFSVSLLTALKEWDRVLALEERKMMLLRKRIGLTVKELLVDNIVDKMQMKYFIMIEWKDNLVKEAITMPSIIDLHYPSYAGFDIYNNWNELKSTTHPISELTFCYAMSCLVFHPLFDWAIMEDIRHISIHMKTDFAFSV